MIALNFMLHHCFQAGRACIILYYNYSHYMKKLRYNNSQYMHSKSLFTLSCVHDIMLNLSCTQAAVLYLKALS